MPSEPVSSPEAAQPSTRKASEPSSSRPRKKKQVFLRLKALSEKLNNAALKILEHVVIIELIIEKLGITDEEIKAKFQQHLDERQKGLEAGSVQSSDSGTDEDRVGCRKQ